MAQPGERVWIRHATEVWEPAVVDAVDGLVQVHAVGGARELTFKDTATSVSYTHLTLPTKA